MLLGKYLPTKLTFTNGLLLISLASFLLKGIDYAWIGSYVPLVIGLIHLCLLLTGLALSNKLYKIMVIFWCCGLIGWGVIRLFLAVIVHFTSGIDEVHVRSQFGYFGIAISVLSIAIGIYLLKKKMWKQSLSA